MNTGLSARDLSQERYRRALLTAATSVGARVITLGTSLISVPLTLHYLGTARYGVWMTLSSFGNLLAFADVGVSNGLINAIATATARGDQAEVRRYVSSAMLVLLGIGALIVSVFWLCGVYVSWQNILSSKSAEIPAGEVLHAMQLFVVCFALSLPATAIYRIQTALQQGYTAGLWQLGASLATLGALFGVIQIKGGLPLLVLSSFGITATTGIVAAGWSWTHSLHWTRPGVAHVRGAHVRLLFHTGWYFLVLQITGSVAYAADNIIIAHVLGPTAVASYSIVARIFEAIVGVAAMFAGPLWPAFADAAVRQDHTWAANALTRAFSWTLVGLAAVAVAVVAGSEPLIRGWLGPTAPYSFALFAAYGMWAVLKGSGATCAAFLNGSGLLAPQVWIAVAFALSSIVARIYAAQAFGLVGIPLALAASYLVCVLIPYRSLIRGYFRTAGALARQPS